MTETALVKQYNQTRAYLMSYKNDVAEIVPEGIGGNRIMRVTLSVLTKTPKLVALAQSDRGRRSLLVAMLESAALGLEPDGLLGQGWIIPYGGVAKFQCGYQGLITLGYRHPKILRIAARSVYAKEHFKVRMGTEDYIEHVPILDPDARGELVAFYALEKLPGGETAFEVDDVKGIQAHRDRYSKAYRHAESGDRNKGGGKKDSPWHTNFDRMAEKTLIIRVEKRGPKSQQLIHGLHTATRDERPEKEVADVEKDAVIDVGAIVDGEPREEFMNPQPADGENPENEIKAPTAKENDGFF